MFVIIGVVVVFGSVIAGYVMHHGNLAVLIQINEFIIIGGAAIGSLLIANPMNIIKRIISLLIGTLKGSSINKNSFLEMMSMQYELYQFAKREGLIALEPHIENPESSTIMSKYPSFLHNHHAVEFFCDTLKVVLSGGVPGHELEELMDMDLEAIHKAELQAPGAVATVSDAFPGLGIVAAVLGVITTMALVGNADNAAIGQSVAAALVGTFFGILVSYGVAGPLAKNMEHIVEADGRYLNSLKAGLLAFAKGMPAAVAVEYSRRAIAPDDRPTFKETEEATKKAK